MSITWLEHWCSPIVRASLIRHDDRGQAPQQQQQQQRNAQIASWFGCWLFYLPQVQSSKKCRVRVPVAFPVAVPTHPFQKKKKKRVGGWWPGWRDGVSAFSIKIAQALDGNKNNNWRNFRGLHSAAFWQQTRQTLRRVHERTKQTLCGCVSAYGTWLFIFLPINVAATATPPLRSPQRQTIPPATTIRKFPALGQLNAFLVSCSSRLAFFLAAL